MRSLKTAAAVLAAMLILTGGSASARQLPHRVEADDAACDPRLGPRLQARLLGVIVNESNVHLETIFLQRPCGAVLARQQDLEAMRIKTAGKPTVLVNGEKYLNLNAFDGLTYSIDPEQQRLSIEGEPAIFYPSVLDFEHSLEGHATEPPLGAFLNYGLFANGLTSGGDPNYSASAGLGIFGAPGVLTSDWLLTHAGGQQNTFRLATTFTHDDEERIATLRLGDVQARGGAFGGGAVLGGVQYGTNFALRPGLITTPVQMMEAATRRNANVNLQSYDANDPQRSSRAAFFGALTTAPYGPVELINIPTYENGDYVMVLRDSYGRETSVHQEFFFNQGLLRQDLTDYSVEAGLQRKAGIGDHYSDGFVSATRRHGESARFTDELHAEATGDGYAAGATGLWAVPRWGVVSLTAAGSHSQFASAGVFGAVGLENRYRSYAYATRVECRDTGFHLPTETSPSNPTACREFATLSGRVPWGDSATVSISNTDQRGSPDVRSMLLAYSRQLLPGSMAQLFVSVSDSAGTTSYSGGLTFNLAFGAAGVPVPGHLFEPSRTNLNLQANGNSQGATTAFGRVSTGVGASDNAYGLQVGAALDGRDQQVVSGSWSGSRAVAAAGLFKARDLTSYTVGASSGLVFMDGGVFASRPNYTSFALVRLGEDHKRVRVNDFHANDNGDLVVSSLQPYYENPINVNAADLPVNARVNELQYRVRPRFRSGLVLKPTIRQPHDALLTVELTDSGGQRVPLPPGAYALVPGEPEPFPVGEDGLIYVSGLDDTGQITIRYRQQQCSLKLKLPPHPPANTTPELGTFLCEGVSP